MRYKYINKYRLRYKDDEYFFVSVFKLLIIRAEKMCVGGEVLDNNEFF